MNLPHPWMRSLLTRRAQPVPPVATAVDPADMGTCFGLELSLVPGTPPRADAAALSEAPWWERAEVRNSCGA